MVREDLVEGAVTFLQDPSVVSSPVEQKIAFLRSKNLTQEEIDVSLARIGQPQAGAPQPQSNYTQQYRQPPQQYGGYQQPPYWGQTPPEPPRRDWRDWFIVATMVGGASYAMYWTAKRYIMPLIAPPTTEQLEQDKASIDESFDKAFALLEQLATDTQELKDSEKARKERLDSALEEVESIVAKMKESNEAQETEAKRLARELQDIREQIPKALQKEISKERETTEESIKGVIKEINSVMDITTKRVSTLARIINDSSNAELAKAVEEPAAAGLLLSSTVEPERTNGVHEDKAAPAWKLPEKANAMAEKKISIPSWQKNWQTKSKQPTAEEVPKEQTNGSGTEA